LLEIKEVFPYSTPARLGIQHKQWTNGEHYLENYAQINGDRWPLTRIQISFMAGNTDSLH